MTQTTMPITIGIVTKEGLKKFHKIYTAHYETAIDEATTQAYAENLLMVYHTIYTTLGTTGESSFPTPQEKI